MLQWFKNKSVLKVWTLSCIFLMLISGISSFYMLLNSYNVLHKESTDKNLYLLKNVVSNADNVFLNIDTLRAVLSNNSELTAMAAQKTLGEEERYRASSLCNALNRIISTHRYIEYFYTYYPDLDLIVSPSSFGESRLFYEKVTANSGESPEQWKNRMDTAKNMSISEKTILEDGKSLEVAEFLIPLQLSFGNDRCIVSIRILKNVLFSDTADIFSADDNQMLILSSRGTPLLHYGAHEYDLPFNYIDLYSQNKISAVTINNKRMNIAHLRLNSSQYHYVYIFSDTESSQKIKQTMIGMVIITVISLSAMLVILFLLSRWNYGNLRNVLHAIEDYDESGAEKNEFSVIAAHIADARRNKNAISNKLEVYTIKMKNIFLSELIKGFTDKKEMISSLQQYNIELEYNFYAIAAINITGIGMAGRGTISDAIFIVDNITADC